MEENQTTKTSSSVTPTTNGCIEIDEEYISPEIQAAMDGETVVMVDTDAN